MAVTNNHQLKTDTVRTNLLQLRRSIESEERKVRPISREVAHAYRHCLALIDKAERRLLR